MVRSSSLCKKIVGAYKGQYQGGKKGEDKIKDGKTTSQSGSVSTSTAVREQPRTVRDGRRLSPMSTVPYDPDQWFRDTGNSRLGKQIDFEGIFDHPLEWK